MVASTTVCEGVPQPCWWGSWKRQPHAAWSIDSPIRDINLELEYIAKGHVRQIGENRVVFVQQSCLRRRWSWPSASVAITEAAETVAAMQSSVCTFVVVIKFSRDYNSFSHD